MKSNIHKLNQTFIEIPNTYELKGIRTDNYNLATENHYADGWRDVIEPILQDNQKLGILFFDEVNDVVSYLIEEVPKKTEEQIQQELHEKETNKYLQRSADGARMYAGLSAEFRIAKDAEIITEEAYHGIEKLLIPTRNEVLAGQWISGLNELETLGSDIIGISLFNRLQGMISNYILENY